jgi:hypothetical protein
MRRMALSMVISRTLSAEAADDADRQAHSAPNDQPGRAAGAMPGEHLGSGVLDGVRRVEPEQQEAYSGNDQ